MAREKRSGFEVACAEILEQVGFEYEPYRIPYHIEHGYIPDFAVGDILVECKGWFRPGDTQKYKAIRDALGDMGCTLVFLLQHPLKRVRKGAKLTMGGWCEKEGIPWFSLDNVEELINFTLEAEKC